MIRYEDFFGTAAGEADIGIAGVRYSNGRVEEFATIFAAQYEAVKATGMLGTEEVPSQQDYLMQFGSWGEFSNEMDQPFLSFVSSVLDITIVKPLIEACTGEDLITGEDLSETECGLKVVFAVIDIVTFGQAIAATKLAELGGKEALKTLGKTVFIDFMSNAAASGMASLGESLDLPAPITMLLSLGAGLSVSKDTGKLLF